MPIYSATQQSNFKVDVQSRLRSNWNILVEIQYSTYYLVAMVMLVIYVTILQISKSKYEWYWRWPYERANAKSKYSNRKHTVGIRCWRRGNDEQTLRSLRDLATASYPSLAMICNQHRWKPSRKGYQQLAVDRTRRSVCRPRNRVGEALEVWSAAAYRRYRT